MKSKQGYAANLVSMMVSIILLTATAATAQVKSKQQAVEELFRKQQPRTAPAPQPAPPRAAPPRMRKPKPRRLPPPAKPAIPPAVAATPTAPASTAPTPAATAAVQPSAPVTRSASGQIEAAGYALRPVELNVSQWPLVRLDFSIERSDRTPFTGLSAAQLQGALDGHPFKIAAGDLATAQRAGAGVLLVIDLSRSMTRDPSHEPGGISKLAATQTALLSLLDALDAQDQVGILAFDLAQHVMITPTTDRAALRAAIHNLASLPATAGGTRLYDAADYALQFAATHALHNVILLSDGCEYSPEAQQQIRNGNLTQFKAAREQAIAERSQRAGLRVFTIAIGNRQKGSALYVDAEALAAITRGTLGGFSEFVDLPALLQQTNGDRAQYAALLTEKLQAIFAQIRQSFHYDYTLTLRSAAIPAPDDQLHTVALNFAVGGAQLPFEFSYVWPTGAAQPMLNGWKVLTPILIETPAASLSRRTLFGVFLALLALLSLLAAIPAGLRLRDRLRQKEQLQKLLVTLGPHAPHIGKACPNEGSKSSRFKAGDTVVICPNCATIHHLDCWRWANNHCWARHCNYELPIPDAVLKKTAQAAPLPVGATGD